MSRSLEGMQSGLVPRSLSEGPPLHSRYPPTSQQTPSDGLPGTQILAHWQEPAPMDQLSVLQGQIAFLQKALTEEVNSHNQIRASRQFYRDATLNWERQYCTIQVQVRDQNAVIGRLKQRVQELEAMFAGRRMAEPIKTQSVSILNPQENIQTVRNMTLTSLHKSIPNGDRLQNQTLGLH